MGLAALAPPSCFVGVHSWVVAQMLGDFARDHPTIYDAGRWIIIVLCVAYLYFAVVVKLWNLFLSKRGAEWDRRDREEQEIDNQEQLKYLKEYQRQKEEKKKRKRRNKDDSR